MSSHIAFEVRDQRTGKKIGTTGHPQRLFLKYIDDRRKSESAVYCVRGRATKRDMTDFLQDIKNMGVPIVFDSAVPADRVYLLAGQPSEWQEMKGGE